MASRINIFRSSYAVTRATFSNLDTITYYHKYLNLETKNYIISLTVPPQRQPQATSKDPLTLSNILNTNVSQKKEKIVCIHVRKFGYVPQASKVQNAKLHI